MSTNHKSRQNKSGRHKHKSNNRGRSQNSRGGRKGGKKQNNQPLTANRQIDSNGPTGKIRGNVKQLYDQYKSLAHDVRTKDRTLSEAYGQFAHHYYILYSEFAAAEAALEVEREKERQRKKEEAAENQSNVVSVDDNSENNDAEILNADQPDDVEVEEEKPKGRSRKKDEAVPLELPLDIQDDKPTVSKKRAPRKSRKPKEEVAE